MLSVENSSSGGGPINRREINVPSDSVYMHFPINKGFLHRAMWENST